MTEHHHLESLLEHTAGRVPVGPPPTERLVREAARSRRSRVATLASVAAVLLIAGGLAGAAGLGGDEPGTTGPAAPATTSETAPPGTRLVGLGSAAIAVPDQWGTNDTRCGVPQRDTVVVDAGPVELCATARAADVDSVEITTGRARFDFTADRTLTVGDESAQRQVTTCSDEVDSLEVCVGTLRLPELGVSFRAESSTDAAAVDRLLEGVRVLDGQVGVPGWTAISDRAQERSGEAYVDLLRRQGFRVRTLTLESDFPGGFVVGATPAPGTVVDVGSEVVVEVSAGD
jgi:hypothetical protein